MAYTIQVNESVASRRVVYLWAVGSNGTTPSTSETGGQPQFSVGGLPAKNTSGVLLASNVTQGEYAVALTASEVSVIGQGLVRYNSASCLETCTPFQVVAYDSGDSMRLGLFSLPNAAAAAAGGLPTFGTGAGQINPSSGSVAIIAGDYSSSVTVGVAKILAGTYSGVTVGSAATILPATYSGVTVGVNAIAAATYSGVTVGSLATVVAGDYSSSVTFGTGTINVASGQSIADRVLARSLAGGSDAGRLVKEALYVLRNRVTADGSTMTVYQTDDATSAFTASLTTTTIVISSVDPTT
jgi:hypothetical protein